MKTKIQAKFVIGFEDYDHCILENAEVVFEGNQILFVGHDYGAPVDRIIEAGDSIISPGFIDLNALGDIDHDLLHFQATPEIATGLIWSETYLSDGPVNALSPEDEVFKNRYAFSQLIRNGITTAMPITSVLHSAWTRTFAELEQAVHIAGELGLRVYLGPNYQSGVRTARTDGSWQVQWRPERGVSGLEQAIKFIQTYDGAYDGLVRGFLAPERIETITPSLLQESKQASLALGCPIRLHAAQSSFEYREIRARHKLTPIAFLESIGFLGPNTLIPHAIYTSGSKYVDEPGDYDLQALSATATSIVHCPLIMARHGITLDTHARYCRAGVNIAMGTDTFPPDMIENIRWATVLAKVVANDPTAGAAADFFRAATLGGARALGREDLGRLAPGAKADLIVIDLHDFRTGQIDDPIKTIIYGTSGANVKISIINGKTVLWDGKIPGQDLEGYRKRAQNCFRMIKRSYSRRDYLQRSEECLFPASFLVKRLR